LKDDEQSLKHYPFEFNLKIKYTLEKDSFSISYEVSSSEDILFSLGAHPAFLLKDNINNTYLEFSETENKDLLCLDVSNGCIAWDKKDYLNSNKLKLQSDIFKDDALIFEKLKSNSVTLKNNSNKKSVNVNFDNFSHIGFWAPVNAPFVCIEPWCGIADYTDTNYNLEDKVGIVKLEKDKKFLRSISISFT
jgi:galactose mutarotase-like enzyme